MHKRTLAFLFLHPLGPHVAMSQFLGVIATVDHELDIEYKQPE